VIRSIRTLCAAAFLIANAAALGAFTFEPMSIAFDPAGTGAVRTFRLKNEGPERVAVRVRVLTRENAEDGSESNDPTPEGLFVVFPARFVLEPGTTRALKVQWKGGDPGVRERAFRIVAEQVPVDFSASQGSGINLLFRYVGALYIRPLTASAADIRVVSAVGAELKGKRGIQLRLRNEGGVHAVLLDVALSLAPQSGTPMPLPPEAAADIEGENLLAGADRLFFVPYEAAEIGSSYDARIAYKAEY